MSTVNLKEITDVKDALELMAGEIAAKNSLRYNLTKTAEEAIELGLVLLQIVNKRGKHQPEIQEVVDEIGDVLLRVETIFTKLGISREDVNKRILHKANKYNKFLIDGTHSEI